jgi:hypothetical protein
MQKAIVVFTARGPEKILAEEGSQAWRLRADRARQSDYLVCTQNRHNGGWGNATEPHGTAFLIGRISEIVPSPERPDRWLIKISEYARISIPNVWQWQYPVRYTSLEELQIDPKKLAFEPVQKLPMEEFSSLRLGDVIETAKQQIAAAAGVPNSAIRISVDLA